MYALVTGGSSGIGYHMAKELRKRGYNVIIVAKNEERLKKAANEIGAIYFSIDLGKDYRKVREIMEKFKPKIVINNAGFGQFGEFSKMDEEEIIGMIKVNIEALTYITRVAMEHMEKGYILNISSVASCHPMKNLAVYSGTKAYVEHFTRSLQRENTKNIRISYLLLGPTRTAFFEKANMPTKNIEKIMLSPEKVAKNAVEKLLRGKRRIVLGFLYKLYCFLR